MALDSQQQRMLERLRHAAGEPVPYRQLRGDGITFPAAVASELELAGHPIDRVYVDGRLVGVRLLEPEPAEPSTERRAHGWRRRAR